MIRLFLILFLSCFSFSSIQAQKKTTIKKRFREAYAAIKSGSGQENVECVLLDSMALPTTTNNIKAEGYHVCALLQQSLNDGHNMKAYLKQNLDTVRLYQTVLKIYDYTVKCDSVDEEHRFYNKNINSGKNTARTFWEAASSCFANPSGLRHIPILTCF